MSTSHTRAYTFREVQYMRQWWVTLIIAGTAALMWYGFIEQIIRNKPFGDHPAADWSVILFWAIFGILFPLGWWSIRLIVEVRADHLRIVYVPFMRRSIPYSEIMTATAITYHPLREFGGWGIRAWFGWRRIAYSVSGSRGVELSLNNGRAIVLGTQQPEQLASAINVQLSE